MKNSIVANAGNLADNAALEPQMTSGAFISQAALAELRRLREQTRLGEKRVEQIRQQLLCLHRSGAEHEPGPLRLEVEEHSSQRLTCESITAAFGAEEYHRLKAGVAPTVTEIVKIVGPTNAPR